MFLVLATLPELSASVAGFFDEMLFSKADSQSGQERAEWNAVAYKTFLDTFGFGAGLGGARASSFLLVLLSNIGVLGAFLFALFIWSVLSLKPPIGSSQLNECGAVIRAAKIGILAVLATASISGTVYDLGLMIYILAGATTALATPYPLRAGASASNPMSLLERRSVSRTPFKIVVFNVKYSENLGDGILAFCIEHGLSQTGGGIEVETVDLAGRHGFGGASSSRRRHLLKLLQGLPKPARRLVVGFVVRRALRRQRGEWERKIAAADAVVIGGGNLFQDDDLNFPLKIGTVLDCVRRFDRPLAIYAVGVSLRLVRASQATVRPHRRRRAG